MEILELKNTISEIKNLPNGLKGRLDTAGKKDQWTWRQVNRPIQSESQGEKKMQKLTRTLVTCRTILGSLTHVIEVPGEVRYYSMQKYIWKNNGWNISNISDIMRKYHPTDPRSSNAKNQR